jgi:hypothetical protein
MAIAYQPPGVTITEETSPSNGAFLVDSTNVCLIGQTRGYALKTVQVQFPGTNNDPVSFTVPAGGVLERVASGQTFVSALDAVNPTKGAGGAGVGYTETGLGTNEVQRLTIANATGGTYTLTFSGQTTSALAYNANAAAIQTALIALSNLATGDVTVSGSGPYTISFAGEYSYEDVPAIVAAGDNLTGSSPTATITTITPGVPIAGDFSCSLSSDKTVVTVTPSATSWLATANSPVTVNFVYRYVADNYFDPIRLTSSSQVQSRFGPALNSTGTAIVTPVSYAAAVAFENGAGSLVIQPLIARDSEGVVTQGTESNEDDWEASLLNLREIEDVNVIVPVIGQSASGVSNSVQLDIYKKLQDHQSFMKAEGQYIFGIFGDDSTTSASNGDMLTLRANADELSDRYGGLIAESNVYISPSKFYRASPVAGADPIAVGGQYMAAAIAGMLAAYPVTTPLTRRQVSGFVSVGETRLRADKDADGSHGLMVIEQKGRAVQVRHSITLDTTNVARRELSVVRAKHNVIESVRTTIDNALPIVADSNSENTLTLLVIDVLEALRGAREIVAYQDVQARVLTGDPTIGEVRFSYRPSFPLNYVNVVFALDLTTGDVNTTTTFSDNIE